MPKGYPVSPRTIGEHLRQVRMGRGLPQREVANLIGVDHKTVANWEVGRSEPALRHWPRIISFLGFHPLKLGDSLPNRLKSFRQVTGQSQANLAAVLGVDESTVWGWEQGHHAPAPHNMRRLDILLATSGPAP